MRVHSFLQGVALKVGLNWIVFLRFRLPSCSSTVLKSRRTMKSMNTEVRSCSLCIFYWINCMLAWELGGNIESLFSLVPMVALPKFPNYITLKWLISVCNIINIYIFSHRIFQKLYLIPFYFGTWGFKTVCKLELCPWLSNDFKCILNQKSNNHTLFPFPHRHALTGCCCLWWFRVSCLSVTWSGRKKNINIEHGLEQMKALGLTVSALRWWEMSLLIHES